MSTNEAALVYDYQFLPRDATQSAILL